MNASEQLHLIAAKLRAAGERELLNGIRRDLRATAQPLVEAVREQARERLPKSGRLNEEQASQAVRISVLSGARSAGVRIRTRTRGSWQTDKGYVRHPVYGTWRKDMPNQELPGAAGWWTKTLTDKGPVVSAVIVARINKINAEIQAR